ncbi:MAG: 3-dehydroquinate synthase [Acholeplasmataceae bacterium]|nr:3-dehydroquinate synthase [Acholeplasmataceae bacterium]
MKEISIKAKASVYPVIIHQGLLNNILNYLDRNQKYVLIHDDLIPEAYVSKVACACDDPLVIAFPAGEKSKTVETHQEIVRKMLANLIKKDAVIIALGGGVTGDLAGYVASTYMRGIAYIQIPTSLLAQIDSAIGGKVGVDFADTKNVLGSIYPPKMVLVDPLTLSTLPKRHFANGMAEMIKYGMIADRELFVALKENNVMEMLEWAIHRSIEIKKSFVEKDEQDEGERRLLNFGHTFGHAIETYYNYEKYLHGEAVAIGMVRIIQNDQIRKELVSVLRKYDLPTEDPVSVDELKPYILKDKKHRAGKNIYVDIEAIGKAFIRSLDL